MSTQSRNLTNIDGANVPAPTNFGFTANSIPVYPSDAAAEAVKTPAAGDIYFNSTEKTLREHNGTSWQYDKTIFSTQTDSSSTGSDQDITPDAVNQIIRFTGGVLTSIRSINPALQKHLFLVNDQASNGIVLRNESTGATAANRILTGNGQDITLKTNQIASLTYNQAVSRWRVTSVSNTIPMEAFSNDAAFAAAHNPPVIGDRYWNTTSLVMRQFDGAQWSNNKVLFSTQNNSSLTGSAADLVPALDQIIKLSSASLTGIRSISPAIQNFLILVNGTGAAISINNEDATATASSRIITGNGADLSLPNNQSILLNYDSNSSRWRVLNPGVIPISSGGTGQTSKSSAFNSLSPATTLGDLITFDGTNNIRLPAGNNGEVLSADNTQPSGLRYINAGGLTNPMTSPGDLITGGVGGVPTRLAGVYNPTTGAWTFGTTAGISGAHTIYGTNTANSPSVDVIGQELFLGSNTTGPSRTNATGKRLRIVYPNYLSASSPVLAFLAQGDSANNILNVGGGNGAFTGLTDIKFYTVPSPTTAATTNACGSVDGIGRWVTGLASGLGTGTAPYHVMYGSLVGNYASGGTRWMLSNVDGINISAGAYRDGLGNIKAIQTATGYSTITLSRATSSSASAYVLQTNYQDAQTSDTAIIATNQRTVHTISAQGSHTLSATSASAAYHTAENTAGVAVMQIKAPGTSETILEFNRAGTTRWSIYNAGGTDRLSIGDTDNSNGVSIGQNETSWTGFSDRRMKKAIADIGKGLDAVVSMRPVEYLFNSDQDSRRKRIGFIAQELNEVVPEVVHSPDEGMWGIRATEIIPVLVKAIQEQNQLIQSLKSRLDAMEVRSAQ